MKYYIEFNYRSDNPLWAVKFGTERWCVCDDYLKALIIRDALNKTKELIKNKTLKVLIEQYENDLSDSMQTSYLYNPNHYSFHYYSGAIDKLKNVIEDLKNISNDETPH